MFLFSDERIFLMFLKTLIVFFSLKMYVLQDHITLVTCTFTYKQLM